jgi:hypothetical protein
MGIDRSVTVEMSHRLYDALMTPGGRFRLIAIGALCILAISIASHIYGRHLASRDILERDTNIQRLQSENQKLEAQIAEQDAKSTALQIKLKSAQDALDALMPAEHAYSFGPNQSMIVEGGRLTVGLIGPPGIEALNINVNDKQYIATAGGVITIALDASTSCRVVVQSFDMFKAMLTASCTEAKPR